MPWKSVRKKEVAGGLGNGCFDRVVADRCLVWYYFVLHCMQHLPALRWQLLLALRLQDKLNTSELVIQNDSRFRLSLAEIQTVLQLYYRALSIQDVEGFCRLQSLETARRNLPPASEGEKMLMNGKDPKDEREITRMLKRLMKVYKP